ncbi:MAG: hypothetical protein D6785_03630 [Planctomycetota bacterium]|nr:MAG: hypothetical protein D6785_03630 [Planctomycetota bacterium]
MVLLFAIVYLGGSPVIGAISAGEEVKIIQDMGLGALSFLGVIVAILVGTTLVYQEVEKRTLYTILSKPVHRYQFILGKFLGLCLVLTVITFFMSLIFFGFLWYQKIPIHLGHFQAILLQLFALFLLTAIATFFSSITTPILTAFFTISFYIAGTTIYSVVMKNRLRHLSETWIPLYKALNAVIPNFYFFNMNVRAAHGMSMPWTEFGFSLLYGSLYIIILIIFSILLFDRRDF